MQTDPHPAILKVESLAERFETPCGAGRMGWRKWGAGPDVLLMHGGSGSWLHWLRTVPALAARHTVWVPDMPGFGESDMPPEPISFDAYCEIIGDGFESLRPGKSPVDLVGFSLGSSVVVRLAARLPVRHLVMSGATYLPMTQRARRDLVSLRRIADPEERARGLLHNLRVMMIAHERNVEDLALRLYDIDVRRRQLPRPALNNLAVITSELPGLKLGGRMSALSGADDQVVSGGTPVQREALAQLRPEADYLPVPGAGHWVMYEAAGAYNEALLRLLTP